MFSLNGIYNLFTNHLFYCCNNIKHEPCKGELADLIISVTNTTAYRFDQSPPQQIGKMGFSGTLSNMIGEIRVFDNNTVFASRSIPGAKQFLMMNKYDGQSQVQYLYKINTSGIRTFSFVDNAK